MLLHVDQMEDCKDLLIRCVNTGTFVHWSLTEAQDGTFVDARFGMDPGKFQYRIFDLVAGKRYFRSWLEQSLDAMQRVAADRAQVGGEARCGRRTWAILDSSEPQASGVRVPAAAGGDSGRSWTPASPEGERCESPDCGRRA